MNKERTIKDHIGLRKGLISLLRSPERLEPLKFIDENKFQTGNGDNYPVIGKIICLLKEKERKGDLGDGKFYDRNPFGARDWSNPEEVESGVEEHLKNLLKNIPKNALIIDVGAGTGRVSNYLSFHGFKNVMSLDFSLNSLKQIEKNSNNLCVWGNNLCLPIATDSFDLVISTGVIHHIPHPHKAVAECARIIKPGGKIYFRTRNIHSLYGYLFFTYGALMRYFESNKNTTILSDLLGFNVYKITRKIFYSHLPQRDERALRGKYENLFTKKLIHFFTTKEIEQMFVQNKLDIDYGMKVSFTHRQHFYVAKKRK